MADVKYSMTTVGDEKVLNVVVDGEIITVTSSETNFNDILIAAVDGDAELLKGLFEGPKETVNKKLAKVSDRVYVNGNSVYVDGVKVDYGQLTNTVIDLTHAGDDKAVCGLVNFIERLVANPSTDSVEQLYNWIERNQLTILDDGHFIAYKGVQANRESVNKSGGAYVNGEWTQPVVSNDGDVVMMPRDQVDDNSGKHCSTGLHVATHKYAKGWAGTLIEVVVNPTDVVSVPNDHDFSKIRVCQYTVVGESDGEIKESFVDCSRSGSGRKAGETPAEYSARIRENLKKVTRKA